MKWRLCDYKIPGDPRSIPSSDRPCKDVVHNHERCGQRATTALQFVELGCGLRLAISDQCHGRKVRVVSSGQL